jgi:probable addiction module antidote protein
MVRLREFDPSASLDDDEVVAQYLTAVLEDANPDVFLAAAGHVAKARGITAIAAQHVNSRDHGDPPSQGRTRGRDGPQPA